METSQDQKGVIG
jgi:hypothetical protein